MKTLKQIQILKRVQDDLWSVQGKDMQNNDSIMDEVTPLEFFLSQNYPNPFKEKTTTKYCIAYKTRVQITVYDYEGNVIEKLVDEEKNPGTYEVEFDASRCHSGESRNLTSGNYLFRLVAGYYSNEKTMLLEK